MGVAIPLFPPEYILMSFRSVFIALVIFCVDLTDAIRTRIDLSEGIGYAAASGANSLPNSESTLFILAVRSFQAAFT